jgi:hypothetical protein
VKEVRADGGAVREGDAEPDLLEDEEALEDGAVVTMSVKDVPLLWRTFPEENMTLSDSRAVATRVFPTGCSHILFGRLSCTKDTIGR